MGRIVVTLVLACFVSACADRGPAPAPSPVSPAMAQSDAGGPPVDDSDSYVSTSCGFPLRVDLTGKLKTFEVPGGRVKVLFPGYRVTLTNLTTGKQESLSITGSFNITTLANDNIEIVYRGRNTYDDPIAGRFLLLMGHFREVFAPDFNTVEPLGGSGQIVDICDALG